MPPKTAAAPKKVSRKPRRVRGPSSTMDSAQIRILEFLVLLMDAKFPVPLSTFADVKTWGSERTARRMRQKLNITWERLRGRPLFAVTDASGTPVERGPERFLWLADTSLAGHRVERMSVLPAFLQLLSLVKGTILSESYKLIYKSWRHGLTRKEQEVFDRTEKKFLYFGRGVKSYAQQQNILDEVYDALVREHWLEITFDRKGSERSARVQPLTLVLFNSGLYLVCLFDNQQAGEPPYKFKIESLKQARCMRGDSFEYPDLYDPNRLFTGAFGFIQHGTAPPARVTVDFAAASWVPAYLKERTWTAAQAYVDGENGRMQLTFEAANLDEVLPWVLSFGPDMTVLEPESLRLRTAEAVAAMARLYAG